MIWSWNQYTCPVKQILRKSSTTSCKRWVVQLRRTCTRSLSQDKNRCKECKNKFKSRLCPFRIRIGRAQWSTRTRKRPARRKNTRGRGSQSSTLTGQVQHRSKWIRTRPESRLNTRGRESQSSTLSGQVQHHQTKKKVNMSTRPNRW